MSKYEKFINDSQLRIENGTDIKIILNELISDSDLIKKLSNIVKTIPAFNNALCDIPGSTNSERLYKFLNPDDIGCPNRKFKSINAGYGFCNRTCDCLRQSKSAKISIIKQSYSDAEKQSINDKRTATSLLKYGVVNNGLTTAALANHRMLYANKSKVADIVSKMKQTKLLRYGNAAYTNIEKNRKTWLDRRTSLYWVDRYASKDVSVLHDKEQLSTLYKTYSIAEIATNCNVHIQTVYRLLNKHGLRDPYSSSYEQEIVNFLVSLGVVNIVRNTRKILPNHKEIDIYLPDYKLGIEFNGVYWHHEDVNHITRTYHYDKYSECHRMGIRLLSIFSDVWDTKKDIVKRAIVHRLGISQEPRIFARRCVVAAVDPVMAKQFLNLYHIQGSTGSASYRYGLYYGGELVALMTFGLTRGCAGIGRKDDGYELIRYASSKHVIGGASKLLSHFIKSVPKPNKIISYSDNEWSDGLLYMELGFNLDHMIPVSYRYYDPYQNKTYHRSKFMKHKLVKMGYDATLPEQVITKDMGLLRIWDCGKRRWSLTI